VLHAVTERTWIMVDRPAGGGASSVAALEAYVERHT
jgi:hypothetical protein